MPTNSGDDACLDNYVDTCFGITAIYIDSDAINCIVIGDFNCQQASRFYTLFTQLGSDSNLILSDINRLSDDTFTYSSDSGLNLSRTDHLVCSPVIDDLVSRGNILYDFVS